MPTWAIWIAVPLGLCVAAVVADFALLYLRAVYGFRRARGDTAQGAEGARMRGWALLAHCWYMVLYKWLPTPHVRLRGLRASADGLYDGQLLTAVSQWWNELLRRRRGVAGTPWTTSLEREAVERMQAGVEGSNSELFRAYARSSAPFDTLADAAMALGYAFSRVLGVGTGSDWLAGPQPITAEQLAQNNCRYEKYSPDISNLGDVPSDGFWSELEQRSLWNQRVIKAMRWAYLDQVRRWEKAEGRRMGSGVGFSPLTEGRLVDRFADLLFENGARFLETETWVSQLYAQLEDS